MNGQCIRIDDDDISFDVDQIGAEVLTGNIFGLKQSHGISGDDSTANTAWIFGHFS